ncbi:MAG: hypothetical protein IAF94_17525 [Pirellulaceae bacterium]|nr:hypothetical protein [Pirellulaceae bacterium]
MTPPLSVRVVKVGGGLFRYQPEAHAKETAAQELPAALASWLARQSPAVHVLVAGGGEFADAVRRADAAHGLGDEAAHWLCVDALSDSARLLGGLVKVSVVTRLKEIPCSLPSLCIFDPAPFLHASDPLPHTWAVTSDSIAARIAEHLAASELVLLKSCLPASGVAGYVDEYFPVAAANLARVRCVNLRSRDFEEVIWASQS